MCVCAHTCSLLGWRTRSVCGVAVGADRAGVPFLLADFQPFSTTEGLVCVVAPAPAAAAAGRCHCAVGHAVHVFRWYLIDLKLVNRCHTSELDCSSPPSWYQHTPRTRSYTSLLSCAVCVGILVCVQPAPGKKRRCLYEAELESVRAALQAERTLRAQLEVQLVQQQAKMAQLEQELTSQKAVIRNKLAHALGDLLAE